jgi:hypothetical protein
MLEYLSLAMPVESVHDRQQIGSTSCYQLVQEQHYSRKQGSVCDRWDHP